MQPRMLYRIADISGGVTFFAIIAALYGAFVYAPTDRTLGIIQRVFYFHVPAAWISFLAFFVVFLGGVLYLWKRDRRWDVLALASAEIGVLFCTMVLITGSLWARISWNTWWAWGDPRLTTSAALWLIYVAYLMLRAFAGESEREARFAAIFGIIGFVDVPLVFISIRIWRTIHPVVIEAGRVGLDPPMVHALLVGLVAFTFLYVYLLAERILLEQARDRLSFIRYKLL